jgi:hypothetical protein
VSESAKLSPEQIAAFRVQAVTREITNRQIDAAVMTGLPLAKGKWLLTPMAGTTRTIYRHVK